MQIGENKLSFVLLFMTLTTLFMVHSSGTYTYTMSLTTLGWDGKHDNTVYMSNGYSFSYSQLYSDSFTGDAKTSTLSPTDKFTDTPTCCSTINRPPVNLSPILQVFLQLATLQVITPNHIPASTSFPTIKLTSMPGSNL